MIEIWKLRFGFIFLINAKERNMNGGGGGDGAASSGGGGGGPPPSLEWRFSQVFGERTAGEEVQEGNILCVRDCEEICFRSGRCFEDLVVWI